MAALIKCVFSSIFPDISTVSGGYLPREYSKHPPVHFILHLVQIWDALWIPTCNVGQWGQRTEAGTTNAPRHRTPGNATFRVAQVSPSKLAENTLVIQNVQLLQRLVSLQCQAAICKCKTKQNHLKLFFFKRFFKENGDPAEVRLRLTCPSSRQLPGDPLTSHGDQTWRSPGFQSYLKLLWVWGIGLHLPDGLCAPEHQGETGQLSHYTADIYALKGMEVELPDVSWSSQPGIPEAMNRVRKILTSQDIISFP